MLDHGLMGALSDAPISEILLNKNVFEEYKGTYPVIFMTFAGVKGKTYADAVAGIKKQIVKLFSSYSYLKEYENFDDNEKRAFANIKEDMNDTDAEYSLNLLSTLLEKYYGKKVLIFLDEYDTPLQEAYIQGYWDEMTSFIRTMSPIKAR